MMKKKNVAVAMAAVTMAGTIAPVVANAYVANGNVTNKNESITTKEYAELAEQLKSIMDVKYTSTNLDGVTTADTVYTIEYTKGTATPSSVVNTTQLDQISKEINNSVRGDEFTFIITDRGNTKDTKGITNLGHVEMDQDLLYSLRQSDYDAITTSMDRFDTTLEQYKELKIENKENLKKYLADKEVDKTTGNITLKFATPENTEDQMKMGTVAVKADFTVVLKSGDHKLDFSKPKFNNGKIVGFEKAVERIGETVYTVKVSNAIKESMNVANEDAAKLAEELKAKYDFKDVTKDDIKEVDGKYQLTLFITNIKLTKTRAAVASSDVIKQLVLKADTKAELEAIVDAINNVASFEALVGENRADTAIKISAKNYNVKNGVNSGLDTLAKATDAIVLVNEYSVVDGLSAAPLAAKKNAPILLTGKDSLSKEVKAEMIRVMGLENGVGAAKTVYIVGGEAVISEDIVTELESMGLTVKRLAGEDRETTSLAVAKELNVKDKAYIVDGYKGLPDAMSISPVAARDIKPIIVVNGNVDLGDDVKKVLKTVVSSEIIGGDAVVSENVEKQIESCVIGTTDRTEGADRQETNANVIKKHFEDVEDFYVAKDGYAKVDQLVDALAIAPVAGEKNAPVVLATNALTTDQAMAIDKVKNEGKTLTQVGGGVKETVIAQFKKVLGLK